MRISSLRLRHFKRFDDLTIELGPVPKKIVALVGPNGSGKSSIFDAFESLTQSYKGYNRARQSDDYYNKQAFALDPQARTRAFDRAQAVTAIRADGISGFGKDSFYIRTAYRFTANLRVDSIQAQPDVLDDLSRPSSTIELDHRLQENYARLLGVFLEEAETSDKPGRQVKEDLLNGINESLTRVLDVHISSLGNVTAGKGQLFFAKEGSTDFPYELLSSGEKGGRRPPGRSQCENAELPRYSLLY